MSRSKMPIDWPAYLGDTGNLTTLEHGAYWLLMAYYWQQDGLPTDEAELMLIAGLTAEQWAASRPKLYRLFKLGNWRHKRIEADLTDAARLSIAGRKGGKASGVSRRKKTPQKQEDRTIVERSANDQPTIREALSKEERKQDAEEPRGSSGTPVPLNRPVYTDSKHELWGEGVPILMQLGMPDRSARSNIGRWLRDTKDDAQSVLGAIQRARDHRVIDPIPWISRALKLGGKPDVAESRSLVAAARRAAERLAGAHDVGDYPGEPVLRLVSQS